MIIILKVCGMINLKIDYVVFYFLFFTEPVFFSPSGLLQCKNLVIFHP